MAGEVGQIAARGDSASADSVDTGYAGHTIVTRAFRFPNSDFPDTVFPEGDAVSDLVTLGKMAWHRLAGFFPNWILKGLYPPEKLDQWILLFATGGSSGGPQFYVTPGRALTVETNELEVVNFLPFSVDLENAQVEILLVGMQLASKQTNICVKVRGMATTTINLRFELSDNQAEMARTYNVNCPILQMGITANFRTRFGLIALRYNVRIRAIIHKE
jgi:hypothetical protein